MWSSARLLATSLAIAAFGVFAGVWAALWFVRGSYLTALMVLLMSIWGFGFGLYLPLTRFGTAKPRVKVDAEGTWLRPPRVTDTVLIVSVCAVFSAAVLYLVFAPLGMLDYFTFGGRGVGAAVIIAALGATTAYRMIKHRGGAHLRLDPDGFESWNGQWCHFRCGTWATVADIRDRRPTGLKPANDLIVFILPQKPSAMVVADAITPNSSALREWVRFYWQHPEHRGELADERALRRLDEPNPDIRHRANGQALDLTAAIAKNLPSLP